MTDTTLFERVTYLAQNMVDDPGNELSEEDIIKALIPSIVASGMAARAFNEACDDPIDELDTMLEQEAERQAKINWAFEMLPDGTTMFKNTAEEALYRLSI
jgi:hypothetical protein